MPAALHCQRGAALPASPRAPPAPVRSYDA